MMETLIGVGCVLALILLWKVGSRGGPSWDEVATRVAAELELELERSSDRRARVTGTLLGLPVEITCRDILQGRRAVTTVAVHAGLPDSLRIHGSWPSLVKEEMRVKLGVELFDADIVACGPPGEVFARLDAEARSKVMEAVKGDGAEFADGQVVLRRQKRITRVRVLARVARRMAAAAAALQLRDEREAARRLADGALRGESPVLRLGCMRALAGLGGPVAQEVGRAILARETGGIVIPAIQALGVAEGLDRLLDLMSRQPSADIRDQAFELARLWAREHDPVFETLGSLLSSLGDDSETDAPPGEVIRAALQAHIDRAMEPPMDSVVRAMGHPAGAVRLLAARVVRELPADDAQPLLIELLEDADDAVRLEAIGGLGTSGTVAAIPHLEALTQGVLRSRQVKRDALCAISSIRERFGLQDGELAVAEDGVLSGELSRVAPGRGTLSSDE